MNYNWNWGVFFQETPEGGTQYWELLVSGLGWTLAVSACAWVITPALTAAAKAVLWTSAMKVGRSAWATP